MIQTLKLPPLRRPAVYTGVALAALAAVAVIVTLVTWALPKSLIREWTVPFGARPDARLVEALPRPAEVTSPLVSPLGASRHEALRTLAHISALADTIGERLAGSPGEERAVEYIAGQLGSLGYHVEVMRFSYDDEYLLPGSVSLGEHSIQGLTISGSAVGRFIGPAVHVELGDAAGFAGKQVRGKVVVAGRDPALLYDAILNARAAGAAALVMINDRQGLIGGWFRPPERLLVVEVGSGAGDALRQAAESGSSITVETTGPARRESANVFARATPDAGCAILIGAHHDTVPASPGANDNASGTATVLELARAFAARGLSPGLCFATFGAEESWWHGSQALAGRLQEEDALPRVMLNLDVTGTGNTVEVIASAELAELAVTTAAELGIPIGEPQAPETRASDHRSFLRVGVPVVFYTSGSFPTMHSPADVAAGINPVALQRVGDLAFATVASLLDFDGTP
jgi:aminopeptidase YwaD